MRTAPVAKRMEVATLRITETGRRGAGHQRLRLMYGI